MTHLVLTLRQMPGSRFDVLPIDDVAAACLHSIANATNIRLHPISTSTITADLDWCGEDPLPLPLPLDVLDRFGLVLQPE